jgi:dipeptidase E
MKLFLTSNGLSNPTIAREFQALVGKAPADTKIAFIPTAANPERGNKHWLINDLYRIKEQGYFVDIIELTAFSHEKLAEILEPMDVIFVGGGNTFYLSYWMQKSGFSDLIPELLKTKVYAGISAGSMVAGKSLVLASQAMTDRQVFEDVYYKEKVMPGEASIKTLNLAGFTLRPHLNSDTFPLVRKDNLQQTVNETGLEVYALDDDSALKIEDGQIEVVSEGECLHLTPGQ